MPDRHLDSLDYKKLFKNRERRLWIISKLQFIPTRLYLRIVYRIKTGKRLHLKNPILFAEKLNWLKVNNIHPEYTRFADKAFMKQYIAESFGSRFVIPSYGVWNSFDEIPFDDLPNQFVLKCTHDSGSAQVVKNKNEMDKAALRKFFKRRLKNSSYSLGREYPYRYVPRRIIAEEYHECENGTYITDLKIMCFNGRVKAFYFISGKGVNGDELITWFDENCNKLDIVDRTGEGEDPHCVIPPTIKDMFHIAECLSRGIPFVRVDFFVDNDRFYFAEMTFYNNGGFVLLEPIEWEYYFGKLIDCTKRSAKKSSK